MWTEVDLPEKDSPFSPQMSGMGLEVKPCEVVFLFV